MPRLTSIITMYNSAPTIAETIRSLQQQTFTDWECLVVNDGSTDNGPAIVEDLMTREPRLRMVTQANRGLPGARNRGIDECRTELVHFLDSDDWMAPRGLEWLVAAAAETGASYGGYELCDHTGRSLGRQSPVSAPLVGFDEQLEWNRTATHAHLFSRDAIGDCRFDERLTVVEDYDMWLRLAMRGEKWKAVERIVAGYRLRPGSMSKQFSAMAACYQAVVAKALVEARTLGWEGKVDLSDRRFRRIVGNMTLTYATMDALTDPSPAKGRAARIYDESARPDYITPALAANTASVALLFGACSAPDIDGWSERRWLSPLRQWWNRCAEEGWFTFDQIDTAFAEFARKVVHPDAVADAMLDAADVRASSTIAVVGLEKNGRRLVRRAAARGARVIALDDFSNDREPALLDAEERAEWGDRVQLLRSASAVAALVPSDAAWLVGPMEGPALAQAESLVQAHAPRWAAVQRWADHRDRIGIANLATIRRSLDHRRALAG